MIRGLGLVAVMLVAAGPASGAFAAGQDAGADTGAATGAETGASRTEATQISGPASDSGAGPGRAYLDIPDRQAPPPPPRDSLVQVSGEQIARGDRNAPTSQISARGQGGPGMAQLSKADLDATLAQLTPAERRVLLQAIEGTDICDNPPDIAAIVALCQNRIETRSAEFAGQRERSLSAEDRLLRGDLDNSALPSLDQVIGRLARGGAASEDFSNQAIASIALGTGASAPARPREEEQPDTSTFGEEAQALINALINQLGGRAP